MKNGGRPNIVYILADDMGYGDVSCLNEGGKIRTEHLDRMARGGIVFRDAHATSAVCTPSRYSILTGRYNWRSTLKRGVLWGYDAPLIERGRMTVASFLKSQGYRTACVGKWHLGWTWPKKGPGMDEVDFAQPIGDGPTTVGFDQFFGISASLDMPPYVYVRDDAVTAMPDRTVAATTGKGFYRAGPISPDFEFEDVLPRMTREAVSFIDTQAKSDAPFFLYFPLPAPHTPILPVKEFQGKSGTNAYGDFCVQVDAVVGQVAAALERNGVADNTILVFTSDNGCSPMADFAELGAAGHNPSYVFRGHKADIYEGGHRIPLIVRWPEGIAPGRVCEEPVCLCDLLATCAGILGERLPEDAGEDSVSNLPLWRGRQGGAPVREAVVHSSMDGSLSIRRGRWKLEMCPGSGGWSAPAPGPACEGLPPVQLYDLAADIGERRNVQAEHPEVVKEMREMLLRYVIEGRSTPGAPQRNTGPAEWEPLFSALRAEPKAL